MINLGRPNVDGSEEDLFLWLIIIPNLLPPELGHLYLGQRLAMVNQNAMSTPYLQRCPRSGGMRLGIILSQSICSQLWRPTIKSVSASRPILAQEEGDSARWGG